MSRILIQLLFSVSPVIFAAISHMIVVKYQWGAFLKYPLDHHITYRKKRLFGKNKTYRGLIAMILFSILFTKMYYVLVNYFPELKPYNLLNINQYSYIFYGVLFGFGYIIGELPNSFYKRQLEVTEGKTTTIFMRIIDQIDSVISITLLLVVFSSFSWTHFVIGILFYGILHSVINYVLFLIGLRKEAF